MTELQDLLFDVELIDNPENTNSEYSKIIKATFPKGSDLFHKHGSYKHLNYCSPTTNLLTNRATFPIIEQMLEDAKCVFSKSYKINSNLTVAHAVYIITEVNGIDVGIDLGNGDNIYPTLMVTNSYNGLKMASFLFGYFRMICSNGIVIPLEGKEESNLHIKGKHTQKLDLSFGTLVEKLHTFIGVQGEVKERFNVLTDRMIVNYGERIEEVMNATKVGYSRDQFNGVYDSIKNEALENYNGKVNDFLIYNGINALIFKGTNSDGKKNSALPEVKRKLDRNVFEFIMNN
jgi:hypothetical protein